MSRDWATTLVGAGLGVLFFILDKRISTMPAYLAYSGYALGLCVVLVGLYNLSKSRRERAESNRFLDNEKHGKIQPPLPNELLALYPGYNAGTPVAKDMRAINCSVQFLRTLSLKPTLAEFLFELLLWTGQEPREYLNRAATSLPKGMPIAWKGSTSKELVQSFLADWRGRIAGESHEPLRYTRR